MEGRKGREVGKKDGGREVKEEGREGGKVGRKEERKVGMNE